MRGYKEISQPFCNNAALRQNLPSDRHICSSAVKYAAIGTQFLHHADINLDHICQHPKNYQHAYGLTIPDICAYHNS